MPYGLYVHIPFCIKKCNYCDFVSVPFDEEWVGLYLTGLGKELALYRDKLVDSEVRTVYIGGGTPTCLSAAQLEGLMRLVLDNFSFEPEMEFTVEANPGTLSRDKLVVLRDAGVNRLSIGAQSFLEKHLHKLGRAHNALDIALAVEGARRAGFDNINLDLMFGLPRQSEVEWKKSLTETLLLQPQHISAYGLKIEEGTPFGKEQELGLLKPVDEDTEVAMYKAAIETLGTAGYQQYEISNFALPGKESRHNLIYWHNEDYLGLGVAAHSNMADKRWNNYNSLPNYLKALNNGMLPREQEEIVDLDRKAEDAIMLGLRLTEGINPIAFKNKYGFDIVERNQLAIEKHVKNGLLEVDEHYIRLTPEGLWLSNEVIIDFL